MYLNKKNLLSIGSKYLNKLNLIARASMSDLVNYVYALKSSSYNYAQMTSEVTVQDDGILSFYILPKVSSAQMDILRSSTGSAFIFYRQSDGRFRVATDDGSLFTFSVNLNLVTPSFVMIRFLSNSCELYVNNELYDAKTGGHTTFTVDKIGEGVTTFGVTLGNEVSYPMLTESIAETNTSDEIGGNNLTYVGIDAVLDESKYIKVADND